MKFAKLAVASAIFTAFSGTALADAVNTTKVAADLAVAGVVPVAAQAGAVTENTQASAGNQIITIGGGNTATVSDAANGVSGNIGINTASGIGNAQGNEAALASLQDASSVFASAQSFSTQVSAVNTNLEGLTNNVSTLNNALNDVSGNVGVNIVSGSSNMQNNQLTAAVRTGTAGDGTLAQATGSNQQVVVLTLSGSMNFEPTNTASITNALNGSGNIGANVAAGFGNLQHNSLSIAAAK